MLTALSTLCKTNSGKYSWTNFLRCDFRSLQKSFRPGVDDAFAILPENFKQIAVEVDGYMKNMQCKTTIEPLKNSTLDSHWKLVYNRGGKSVFGFQTDTDCLGCFVYFNRPENISRMGYILKEESDILQNWFCDKIPNRLCSCPNNRLVDIGGQKKRICGLMNRMDVINPVGTDFENLKKIVGISLGKELEV